MIGLKTRLEAEAEERGWIERDVWYYIYGECLNSPQVAHLSSRHAIEACAGEEEEAVKSTLWDLDGGHRGDLRINDRRQR